MLKQRLWKQETFRFHSQEQFLDYLSDYWCMKMDCELIVPEQTLPLVLLYLGV
jgi:hypothetical protein